MVFSHQPFKVIILVKGIIGNSGDSARILLRSPGIFRLKKVPGVIAHVDTCVGLDPKPFERTYLQRAIGQDIIRYVGIAIGLDGVKPGY